MTTIPTNRLAIPSDPVTFAKECGMKLGTNGGVWDYDTAAIMLKTGIRKFSLNSSEGRIGTIRRSRTGWVYQAMARSPKGGVTIAGTFYKGGKFIPNSELEKATPEERAKLTSKGGGGGAPAAATPPAGGPAGGATKAPAAAPAAKPAKTYGTSDSIVGMVERVKKAKTPEQLQDVAKFVRNSMPYYPPHIQKNMEWCAKKLDNGDGEVAGKWLAGSVSDMKAFEAKQKAAAAPKPAATAAPAGGAKDPRIMKAELIKHLDSGTLKGKKYSDVKKAMQSIRPEMSDKEKANIATLLENLSTTKASSTPQDGSTTAAAPAAPKQPAAPLTPEARTKKAQDALSPTFKPSLVGGVLGHLQKKETAQALVDLADQVHGGGMKHWKAIDEAMNKHGISGAIADHLLKHPYTLLKAAKALHGDSIVSMDD